MLRPDGAEHGRRLGDLLTARCQRERRGGRVAAGREPMINEAACSRRQARVLRGQRSMTFDGEVPPGDRRAPQPGHDVGVEAAGREQRRLDGDGAELIHPARPAVDEHRGTVGPRRLAGIRGRHVHQPPGDSGSKQREPSEFVGVCAICRRMGDGSRKHPVGSHRERNTNPSSRTNC